MNPLLQAVVDHARQRPDAPALVHLGRVAHTWASLLAQVGARASGLRAGGVGPGERVLLLRSAGPEWVVDALATWAVGGAIVPIDPALPRARRQALAKRAEARARLGPPLGLGVVSPQDGVADAVFEGSPPGRLAWLLFSSGSTGVPKGVRVPWGNYVDVLAAQVAALGLSADDRCAWLLSPGFDASLSDVGVALLSGAALHTEAPGLLRDPVRLQVLLHQRRITYTDLPPRYLDLLQPADLPHLRAVLCGGEPLPPEGARRWSEQRRLIGVYGPTEATICASLWRVDPHDVHRAHLGKPVAGARFRRVDGELWIGGPGLALGYLDPVRTAGRFVEVDGERWHRSGDRVRVDVDGAWLFDGRVDRQAKVDGRLVCPEEVEAALRTLPGVHDARVDVVERGGVAILVASVEGEDGLTPEQVRTDLSACLPAWMVPRVLDVGTLQRGPSGKTVCQDDLSKVVFEVLGRMLSEGDSFAAAGLDSLRALDVAARLMARDIVVAPEQVRSADCLARLRSMLTPPTLPVSALVAEGRRLAWRGTPDAAGGDGVLLTGATGGLGARLLPRLLASGHRVHALVRARDARHACDRVAAALRRVGENGLLVDHPGLSVLAGALPDAQLDGVSAGLVVHLAAAVDLSADAATLRPTNVDGTRQLVSFAGRRGIPMLHASTLSVFVDTDAPRGRFTAKDPLPEAAVCGGYGQTKLLAEVVVRSSDLSSCCVRYGLLVAGSGSPGAHDWLPLALKGLSTLGCVPDTALHRALEVDLTLVPSAADLTLRLAQDLLIGAAPPVVHVAAPETARLVDLLAALDRAGVTIETVDELTFLDRARFALSTAEGPVQAAALLGLARGLRPDALGVHRSLDLFQATGCRFAPMSGVPAPSAAVLDRVVRAALGPSP